MPKLLIHVGGIERQARFEEFMASLRSPQALLFCWQRDR
jgi:hypothetical protein